MNILVMFLRDHPEAVRELVDQGTDTVPLEAVVDLISRRGDFPVALDGELLAQLDAEPLAEAFINGYLPVVHGEHWRGQVADAQPPDHQGGAEWVTFVASPGDDRGISLPEESDATVRASVFTRVQDSVRRVSVEYADVRVPTSVALSLGAGCSLPDWGVCSGAECHGDCELRRRHDDDDGLACRCPHS
jgi:hypothetical protein